MKILLLSYLSRSGSTLIASFLNKDDRFCVCPEAEVLTNLLVKNPTCSLTLKTYKKIVRASIRGPKLNYWGIKIPKFSLKSTNIEFFELVLLEYVLKNNPKAEFIVFKSEGLESFNVKDYNNYSKIVLFRDPRAIFLSQKNSVSSLGKGKMNCSPNRVANQMNKLIESVDQNINNLIYLKYEDFLVQESVEIKKIQRLLNIDSFQIDENKNILDIIPKSQKHLHENLNKKNMHSSISKWKNELSKYEIFVIQKDLIDTLNLDYDSIEINLSFQVKFINKILFFKKDFINRSIKAAAKI